MTSSFAELGLSAKVLAAIEAAGYPSPTPIQAQAIPVATTGRDILGIAQTGTGKTASFVLPMITRLESGRARARMPRSLILAPTRELAAQVAQSFEKYGINHKLSVALLIGGVSMDDQLHKLDRGVDVLIATPGRLLDHFGRGKLMLMGVEILVIDEADRMLDMGFIPDIEKICKLLPPRRQTLFFSATMPPEITRLVDQFLKDPARIEVARPATTAKTITQRFRFCPSSEDWAKRQVLRDMIHSLDVKNAIIFCNRKRDVAILLKSLTKHGFNAGALHGDMDQMSRTATLDKFRSGEITLLAASDVAARGLDIPDVSHIFNFDVPWQPDDYVHRIGRTGRAGKEGFSATIVTPDDIKSMEAIAKLIGEETVWLGEIPDEQTLAEGRLKKRGRGRGGRHGSDARSTRGRGDARREHSRDGARNAQRPNATGPQSDRSVQRRWPERPELTVRHERSDAPRTERPVDRIDEPHVSTRPESRQNYRNRDEQRPEWQDRPQRSRQGDQEARRDRPSRPTGNERAPDGLGSAPRRTSERRASDSHEPREISSRRDEPRVGERKQAAPRERFGHERDERFGRDERPPGRGDDRREIHNRHARDERHDRSDRHQPHDRGEEHAPREHRPQEQSRASHRERAGQRERGRERNSSPQGTGLGDHVPAFLRRPVRANAD